MQCLILAGGLGTRMQSVAPDLPKTLVPVAGRPFADHQLSWLRAEGVRRVIYAIGHHGEAVRAYAGDGRQWGLEIAYSDEGDARLGTAGAVHLAVHEGLLDGGFFVLYGDSYLRVDLSDVWAASGAGAWPLMTVFRNQGRWDSSNAKITDGMVILYEKGRVDTQALGMDHIDYGLSVLNRNVIGDNIGSGEPADLAHLFHRLSVDGQLRAFEATQRFYEIGSPQGLADLEAHLSAAGS